MIHLDPPRFVPEPEDDPAAELRLIAYVLRDLARAIEEIARDGARGKG